MKGHHSGNPAHIRAKHALDEFVAARDRGDYVAMKCAWATLLTERWDFVRHEVDSRGYKMLSAAEREDAVQETARRLASRVIWVFRGTSLATFDAMVARAADFECRTEQRRAANRSSRNISLDEPTGRDADARTIGDVVEAEGAVRHGLADEDAGQDAHYIADRQEFLDWAVPRLSAKQRQVLELIRRGQTVAQVMDTLGMRQNAVHQTRARAIRELRTLYEHYIHDDDRSGAH